MRRGRGRDCAPAALDRALLGGPSTSPLERTLMTSILGIVPGIVVGFDVLVQWAFTWRYLVSPSFRHSVQQRWRSKSRLSRSAERAFGALCFVIVNILVAAILWRIFVGPLKPIHEWNI
jgi:hypothetical protein